MSADDHKIADLITILAKFREIDPAVPLTAVQVFLTVARHKEVKRAEVMEAIDLDGSKMTRDAQRLGEVWSNHAKETPGMGLIFSAPDPEDGSKVVYTLTQRGQKFLADVILPILRRH